MKEKRRNRRDLGVASNEYDTLIIALLNLEYCYKLERTNSSVWLSLLWKMQVEAELEKVG